MKRVFLSGGLGTWMSGVREQLEREGLEVVCPEDIGSNNPFSYAFLNKQGVLSSDAVLAFLEQDNPNGLGLAFECGYATALGKPLFYADDFSGLDKRAGMIYGDPVTTWAYPSLSDAVDAVLEWANDPQNSPL